MATKDHTHPDHTCPRCRDAEERLRPDYNPRRRTTSPREDPGHWEHW